MRGRTRIKLCGMSRREDIAAVNEAGPDYCGFIVDFPKSHRSVSPDEVRALSRLLAPKVTPVGVFVNAPAETILSLVSDGAIRAVQLHGAEDAACIRALRQALPADIPILKAFRVRTREDVRVAGESPADYILLDNGTGTGERFDWSLLEGVARPYFLAGGLGADNLKEAIRTLHPFAVDLSSKLETEKKKDRAKILAAVRCVREADAAFDPTSQYEGG